MPEKHDLFSRHSRVETKNVRTQSPFAFAMAYLHGGYNGGAFTKAVIDATMCAIIIVRL